MENDVTIPIFNTSLYDLPYIWGFNNEAIEIPTNISNHLYTLQHLCSVNKKVMPP